MSDDDEHTRLLAGEYEEDDLHETNPSTLLLGPLGPSPNAITGPISPDTWVMRPTSTSMQSVEFLTSIRGFQCQCRKCGALATDPVTCSQCGSYGHTECLGLELFQGFPFCAECLCGVIAGYAEHRNRQMRAQWRLSYVDGAACYLEDQGNKCTGTLHCDGNRCGRSCCHGGGGSGGICQRGRSGSGGSHHSGSSPCTRSDP